MATAVTYEKGKLFPVLKKVPRYGDASTA